MNIAIVGCGIGGIHILKTIINHKNFNKDLKIHIFETRKELGVGLAYEDDTKYKLLNVHEEYVSLELGNPDHIYNWLDKNPDLSKQIEGMLPRRSYGEYIKDTYKEYIENENVIIHHEKVVDIYKDEQIYNISIREGEYHNFKTIFLAIGQPHYSDAYNLYSKENFIFSPYPLVEKLENGISNDETIGVIGAGPASVDIYRYLSYEYDLKNPIYFFTKESAFPIAEVPYEYEGRLCTITSDWIDKKRDDNGFISLGLIKETINKDFRKEGYDIFQTYERYKDTKMESNKKALKENDKELGFAQCYTMEVMDVAAKLYNSLSGLDKLKVDNDYLDILDFILAKTPTKTMEHLIEDYDKGNINIIRGTEDIEIHGSKFLVKSDKHDDIRVDKIVNAQGFENTLTEAIKKDELLKNLYDHRFIEADIKDSFIKVTYPSYNLISKKYGVIEDIYLSGLWAGSTDIKNNDVRSILIAAELIANDFMSKL